MSFNYTYNYPQIARDSGFKLRNYKDGPLDWRLMGSLEVDRILRDQSLEQIDSVLSHLSEAPLGSILESNILDSGIAKYFIFSQFSVQYLLFCRKFLEETISDLRESHGVSQMELATLKKSLSEANNEILQLHKKITQMEAIHEVIYPCHLCTKNFVSNDALNLHISRKHNGFTTNKPERRSDTHQALVKERENDLTLINTIKLELEIKQLKERLNNTEKEIKERNQTPSNICLTKDTRDCCKPEKQSVNSIGIQSNLSEIKEKDDNSAEESINYSQNREQLSTLQVKLQEIEQWKDEQKNQNSEFLNEIKNKLQDLTEAWEMAKLQREQEFNNEKLRSSPSVEDLEVLLSKKVDDIGKASAAKLEDVVNKIENNYRKMFQEVEKEMTKINNKPRIQNESKSNSDPLVVRVANDLRSNDETFEILKEKTKFENSKENSKIPIANVRKTFESLQPEDTLAINEKSTSSSNHTFVKNNNVKNFAKDEDQNNFTASDENDGTDISDSLQEEEERDVHISKNQNKTNKSPKERSEKLRPPKIVTSKQAMKLTNSRLKSLGVDIKAKTLTHESQKRISEDLNDKRNKLKQKYPHYYATRNKIKKYVDKLCSSKMPKNAEALLKVTNNVKPFLSQDFEHSSSSEDDNKSIEASTPLNDTVSTHKTDFKQRLAHILASPIKKPEKSLIQAVIHHHQPHAVGKPIPMPRKRVMFNQPMIREKRLDDTLSNSESNESISSQRYQKTQGIKSNLATSIDSFI